jgi:hypothetical protein
MEKRFEMLSRYRNKDWFQSYNFVLKSKYKGIKTADPSATKAMKIICALPRAERE